MVSFDNRVNRITAVKVATVAESCTYTRTINQTMKNLLLALLYSRLKCKGISNSDSVLKSLWPFIPTAATCSSLTSHQIRARQRPLVPNFQQSIYSQRRLKIICGIRSFSNDVKPKKFNLSINPDQEFPGPFTIVSSSTVSFFAIRRHLDSDFDLMEFVEGAKKALEVISHILAEGNVDMLEDLVTEECLAEIKNNISNYSVQERSVAVKTDDIQYLFIDQVDANCESSGDDGEQLKSVAITVVFCVSRNLGEHTIQDLFTSPNTLNRELCKYTYVRDYSKGNSEEWKVDTISHTKVA